MIPKISVIIPTCNRPKRVKNAIQSVLNQTFSDFEIIVVDDGLKQRAEDSVNSFKDNRIRYIKHEANKGGGAARNTGIKNAKAGLIAFLDDDDEYLPKKLEEQCSIIKKHENEIGFVFCAVEFYYEADGRISVQSFSKDGINNFYELLLAHQVRILTPSLLIKKDVLEKAGCFDEIFPSSQEWELMIRAAKKNKGYYLDKVLARANFLKGEHIGGNLSRRIRGRELLLKKHLKELKKRPRALSRHYFQLGIFCRDNKEFKKARQYFFKAWALDKSKLAFLLHYASVAGGKMIYKLIRKLI